MQGESQEAIFNCQTSSTLSTNCSHPLRPSQFYFTSTYIPQVWKGEVTVSTWERGGKAADGKEWVTHQKPEELFVQVVSTLFGLEMSVNYNDRVIAPYIVPPLAKTQHVSTNHQ